MGMMKKFSVLDLTRPDTGRLHLFETLEQRNHIEALGIATALRIMAEEMEHIHEVTARSEETRACYARAYLRLQEALARHPIYERARAAVAAEWPPQ